MRIDLHNHTILCNHATGTMEEYVKKAIALQINDFGFSCHAPMNFDEKYRMKANEINLYENNILKLKEKYKDKINILLAYEVDYIDDMDNMGIEFNKDVLESKSDYLIGSVHFLGKWGFDNPEYLGEYKKRNMSDVVLEYYKSIQNMADTKLFDIVGHIDLIKVFGYTIDKNNKNVKNAILDTLEAIKQSNMSIEINTAGLRKQCNEIYPSSDILTIAYEMGIDITFSSDAHKVEHIGYGYEDAIKLAKNIGYKHCVTYKQKQKIQIEF